MPRYAILADRLAAIRLSRAVGRSSAYTRGGRPPLPRCDHPRWGDPEVRQGPGRHAPCPCPAQDQPRRDCPYLTHTHQEVLAIAGVGYAVRVDDPLTQSVLGERVDVDGVEVVIDASSARELTEAERGARERAWSGAEDVETRTPAVRPR